MKLSKFVALFVLVSNLSANVEKVEFIANEIHKTGDITEASGDVLVYSPSYLISADLAKYDQKNEIVELFGNVSVLRNNEETTNSQYAKIDLKSKDIFTDNAFAMHQNKELWLQSDSFCSNEASLDTTKSIVSSCNVEDPDWHIEYSSGYLNKESKYLHLFNPVFYGNLPLIGQTPLFYLPYFGFSTDKTRRTGLLTPKLSISKGEGFYYEQPIYIAEYDSWDLEFNPQIRTSRGYGIYTTFRFADSPYSNGFVRFGYFKDKNSYRNKHDLKNSEHKGVEVGYERDKLAGYLLEGDYKEGLYLDFMYLNDVDYINLKKGVNLENSSSLVHSRLNYFINFSEHYLGLYGDYYIDTAKIGTKYGNKDTLQELPTLQYHSYFDTFLSKNITYSLDAKFHNYTRRNGTTARKFELDIPVGLNIMLPDNWANISYTTRLYGANVNYSNSYELSALGKRDNKSDAYIRNWHEFSISTDLAKALDIFGGMFHTLNLGASFVLPGYKHGDFKKYLYAYDKNEAEENFIEELDERYTRQAVELKAEQYLFNSDNQKVLRHSINTFFNTKLSSVGSTTNRIDLYFDNWRAFSKLSFDHKYRNLTKAHHGFNVDLKYLDFELRHSFDRIYTDEHSSQKSNYIQSFANLKLPKAVRLFGAYAYDIERRYTKLWRAGISQNRKCWNYGIYYEHNTEPITTSAGPDSKSKNSVMLFFVFYPFGDFSYQASIKSNSLNDEGGAQ